MSDPTDGRDAHDPWSGDPAGVQLVGELLAQAAGLPLPGPVIGLVLMLGALVSRPALLAPLQPAADGLNNLSLLFVPAGVGAVQYFGRLANPVLASIGLVGGTLAATGVSYSSLGFALNAMATSLLLPVIASLLSLGSG